MARYDKDIDTPGAQPLSDEQLLGLLGQASGEVSGRTEAVARFLARAEGWQQAARQLDGAFSDCSPVTGGKSGAQG